MGIKLLPHNYIRDLLFLIVLLAVTIFVTYYVPTPLTNIWYILILVMYSFSKNEALWLAFFLATVDGFMGLMGLYSLTLTLLPGLPGIELAQIYILIALIKAISHRVQTKVFYFKYLQLLFVYVIILILVGQSNGFTGDTNTYFRVIKMVFPLTLFFSIPRLFSDMRYFERFFMLVFFIFLFGFGSQLVSLLTGIIPFSSVIEKSDLFSEPGSFRGYYNSASTLIALYAALAYLSLPGQKAFSRFILYVVISSALGMAIISATRGWIIGFGVIIFLQLLFIFDRNKRGVIWLGVFMIIMFVVGLSNLKIKEQVDFSKERLMTLESLSKGDITAENTLQRLSLRGPAVMKAWREAPLFGCGFSDAFWKHGDGHVGNQNILLLSGIIGFILLMGFLTYFTFKITEEFFRKKLRQKKNQSLILFPVFLLGWFIIHSTSGQQFGFSGLPLNIIPQAVFFSFGAMVFAQSKATKNGEKIPAGTSVKP